MLKKRVKAKTFENILFLIIIFLALATLSIFIKSIRLENPDPLIVVILLLIIILMAILGLTHVVVKIWDQHIQPDYIHKINHQKSKKKN